MKIRSDIIVSPDASLVGRVIPNAPSQSPSYRDRVNAAYAEVGRRQGEFIRSVCAFGALFDEVAMFLGVTNGGDHTSDNGRAALETGGTLQTWLAENCPGVNYKTAMGYRALAAKAVKMLGGGTVAIAALQGRETVAAPGSGDVVYIDNAVIKARDELFEKADSRRKLEQLYFEFMRGAGRGARRGGRDAPLATRSAQDNAKEIWARALTMLSHKTTLAAIALLPEKETDVAWGVVKEIYEALKDHLKEF